MKIKIGILIFLYITLGIERFFTISEWFLMNYLLLGVSIISLTPEVFKLIKNLADKPLIKDSENG